MLVAAVAGVAFLLFGSGASQNGPIAQAATLSSKTAGFRMRMSVEVTSSALSAPVSATGTGIIDLRDRAASMSMSMDLGNEPQAVQQLGSPTLKMDMVMSSGSIYLKVPSALGSVIPMGGKQWIKVDLGKLASVPGFSSLGGNPAISDPTRTLQYLRSASNGVVNLGQNRIDGLMTTHYRANISVADLAKSSSAAGGQAKQILSMLQQSVPGGQIPLDVWIDRQSLVRRVQMAFDLSLPTGQSMHEGMTMDLSDYGPQPAPVTPSPDQVFDLSGLPQG